MRRVNFPSMNSTGPSNDVTPSKNVTSRCGSAFLACPFQLELHLPDVRRFEQLFETLLFFGRTVAARQPEGIGQSDRIVANACVEIDPAAELEGIFTDGSAERRVVVSNAYEGRNENFVAAERLSKTAQLRMGIID
jgi:hypothetical protein